MATMPAGVHAQAATPTVQPPPTATAAATVTPSWRTRSISESGPSVSVGTSTWTRTTRTPSMSPVPTPSTSADGSPSTSLSESHELEATATATPATLTIGGGEDALDQIAAGVVPPNTMYEAALRSGFPLQDRVVQFTLRGARFATRPPNTLAQWPTEGAFLRSCIKLDTTAAPPLAAFYSRVWGDASVAVTRPPLVPPPGVPASATRRPDVLSITLLPWPEFSFDAAVTSSSGEGGGGGGAGSILTPAATAAAPTATSTPNATAAPTPAPTPAPSAASPVPPNNVVTTATGFEHVPEQYVAPADPTTVPFAVIVDADCLAGEPDVDGVATRGGVAAVRSDPAFLRRGASHQALRGGLTVPPIATLTVGFVAATGLGGAVVGAVVGPAVAPLFPVATAVTVAALLGLGYGDGRVEIAAAPREAGAAGEVAGEQSGGAVYVPAATGTYTVLRMLLRPVYVVERTVGFAQDAADASADGAGTRPSAEEGTNVPQGPLETTIGAASNSVLAYAATALLALAAGGVVAPVLLAAALKRSELGDHLRADGGEAGDGDGVVASSSSEDGSSDDDDSAAQGGGKPRIALRPPNARKIRRELLAALKGRSGGRGHGDDSSDDDEANPMARRVAEAAEAVRKSLKGTEAVPPGIASLCALLSRCTFQKAAAALAAPSRLAAPLLLIAALGAKLGVVAIAGAAEGFLSDSTTVLMTALAIAPMAVYWIAAVAAVLSPRVFRAIPIAHDPTDPDGGGRPPTAAVGGGGGDRPSKRDRRQKRSNTDRSRGAQTASAAAEERRERLWRRWARVFFPAAVAAEETRRRAVEQGADGTLAVHRLMSQRFAHGLERRRALEAQREAAMAERAALEASVAGRRGEGAAATRLADRALEQRMRASRHGDGAGGDFAVQGFNDAELDDADAALVDAGGAPDESPLYLTVRGGHRVFVLWLAERTRWRSMMGDGASEQDSSATTPSLDAPVGFFAETAWGWFGPARGGSRWAVVMVATTALLLAVLDGVGSATTTHTYFGVAVGRSTVSAGGTSADEAEQRRAAGGPITAADGVRSASDAQTILWLGAAALVAQTIAVAATRPFASPARNVLQGVHGLLHSLAAIALALAASAEDPFVNFPEAVSLAQAQRYRVRLPPATPSPDGGGSDGALSLRFVPSRRRLPPEGVEIPDLPWRDAATRLLLASVAIALLADVVLLPLARITFDVAELHVAAAWHHARLQLHEAEAQLRDLAAQAAELGAVALDPATLAGRKDNFLRDMVAVSPLMRRKDAHLIGLEDVAAAALAAAAQSPSRRRQGTENNNGSGSPAKQQQGRATPAAAMYGLAGLREAKERAERGRRLLEGHVSAMQRRMGDSVLDGVATVSPASVAVPFPRGAHGRALRRWALLQGVFCAHVAAVTSASLVRLGDALRVRETLERGAALAGLERDAAMSPLLRLVDGGARGGGARYELDGRPGSPLLSMPIRGSDGGAGPPLLPSDDSQQGARRHRRDWYERDESPGGWARPPPAARRHPGHQGGGAHVPLSDPLVPPPGEDHHRRHRGGFSNPLLGGRITTAGRGGGFHSSSSAGDDDDDDDAREIARYI